MPDILKRNNVTVKGSGEKTIFFAHGFGCDQNSWKYIEANFAADHKIVLFDYVGAGRSDLKEYDAKKYDSLQGYSSDVIEICNELDLKKVIFIGHSVSCMIGLLAAIEKPALFEKLVFIGPSPCYINDREYIGGFDKETIDSLMEVMEEDYISWSKSLAPAIMNEGNGESLGKELTDSFCSIDPQIAKQFARVTFLGDNRKDLSRLNIPSLTIQCSGDTIAPPAVGKYMNKHTPKNTITVIDGAGHCLHMSQPEKTITAIRAFL